jgi:hypothetical protein
VVLSGAVKIEIKQTYPLKDAAQAHRDWSRARPWARRCSRCERSNPLSAVPGTRTLGRLVILPGRANPTGFAKTPR